MCAVLYADVCGPFQTDSLGGNKHFVSLIDAFTRRMWIYLIKRKNEVFEICKRLKAMAEKQSGENIKILRTDGGGEYVSHELTKGTKGSCTWRTAGLICKLLT